MTYKFTVTNTGQQVLEFGTIIKGLNYWSRGGTWKRQDVYINRDTGEEFHEHAFSSGPNDLSDRAINYGTDWNVKYNPNCSCCYLGTVHTVESHNKRISA